MDYKNNDLNSRTPKWARHRQSNMPPTETERVFKKRRYRERLAERKYTSTQRLDEEERLDKALRLRIIVVSSLVTCAVILAIAALAEYLLA